MAKNYLVDQKKGVAATMSSDLTRVVVTSDGRTNEDFIRYWKEKNYSLSALGEDTTRRAKFVPTKGTEYCVRIILGSVLSDEDRSVSKIRAIAGERFLLALPFEAACLLREAVSDKMLRQLGLGCLLGMHHPVTGSDGHLTLLGIDRSRNGREICSCLGNPERRRSFRDGFAFLEEILKRPTPR